MIFQGGGEAAGSSSLGPSEVWSAEAMGLTLAVRTGLQPAARLWIGRLSHHGLQFSPLRNGRNEGLTSRICHGPGARRQRAREGKAVLGGWGRNCHCLAPLGHHRHALASAASRVPRLQHVSREPSWRSFQVGARGPGTEGPSPLQYLDRGPEQAEARAEDVMPPAAVDRGASLRACLSHRWTGRGGAFVPRGAQEDSAPWNLAKNSLPPGRVLGLLPFPTPYGP